MHLGVTAKNKGLAGLQPWACTPCSLLPHCVILATFPVLQALASGPEKRGFLFSFFFSLSFIFLYLKECQGRKMGKRERDIFHLLGHSSNGCNGKCWPRPKPGARDFIQVSMWVHEPKHLDCLALLS